MFLSFPPDVSLYILSFVSLHDIHSLSLVAREARALIINNEPTVYHQAAIVHRFVPAGISLEKAKRAESQKGGWLDDVQSWKELCRRWTVLEHNWDGKGPVLEGGYASQESVLHFKVDEEQKTLLSVSRSGGMTVHAMEDNRVLWKFSPNYLFRSRCELSNGFLIFPSQRQGIEIWRRSADVVSDSTISTPVRDPSPSAALEFQFAEAKSAAQRFPPGSSSSASGDEFHGLRGQYVPHAYLGRPYVDMVRIYRVRFPLLALLSGEDRNAVLLFDIRDGTMLRRVSFAGGAERIIGAPQMFVLPPPQDRVVMDMDVTDNYISVCLHAAVMILPRQDARNLGKDFSDRESGASEAKPSQMLVLTDVNSPPVVQQTAMQLGKTIDVDRSHTVPKLLQFAGGSLACVAGAATLKRRELVPPAQEVTDANSQALVHVANRMPPCFISARFSPDGRHLAAMTASGVLYIAEDFARVEQDVVSFADIMRCIYLGEWSRDLIWEDQPRRLVVQTAAEDIFIVNLDTSYHFTRNVETPVNSSSVEAEDPYARIAVYQLADFSNPGLGWSRVRGVAFSGAQITRTTLWMIWDLALLKHANEQRARRKLNNAERISEEDEEDAPLVPSGSGSICFISFTPNIQNYLEL